MAAILLVLAGASTLFGFEASGKEQVSITSSTATATTTANVTLEQGDAAFKRRRYQAAFSIYSELAQQGNAQAQLNLGGSYAIGKGVQRNDTLAALWYTRAAEQGLALAQVIVAENYERGDRGFPLDPAAAVPWYQKAADQGFSQAQNEMGRRYTNGEGVMQDYAAAASWYEKSALQGDAEGQYWLGLKYNSGEGVAQDYTISAKWLLKAAEQGRTDAQILLGPMIAYGIGVPQDPVQGLKWVLLGKSGGDYLAVMTERQVASRMTPAQISEALMLARRWRKPLIEQTIR